MHLTAGQRLANSDVPTEIGVGDVKAERAKLAGYGGLAAAEVGRPAVIVQGTGNRGHRPPMALKS
jgi:hypothetical protein